MSHYTTEVRFICETYAGYNESQGYTKVDEIIAKARPKIFDFYYPIFDEAYRSVIETKILRHYYTREIGCETVGRWKLFLQAEMNEIMPFYNQLYASELIKFNPLYDVDITTDHHKDGAGEGNSKIDSDRWRYYHDTPQGGVNGIASLKYLTEAERNDDKSKNASDYKITEDYLEHVKGKRGDKSYSKMLQEYRDTFLNIDMLIIDRLSDLFMIIY